MSLKSWIKRLGFLGIHVLPREGIALADHPGVGGDSCYRLGSTHCAWPNK